MSGWDLAIWITLGAEALVILAITVPAVIGKPHAVSRAMASTGPRTGDDPDKMVRGCAWVILGFGMGILGVLALLTVLLPWRWAKIAILVASLWLPASMIGKILIGGAVDGIGRLVRRKPE